MNGVSLLAGKPAAPEMLVDVSKLEGDYYDMRPEVEDPSLRSLRHERTPWLIAARIV